jgi:Solute carrier family 35
MLIDSFAIPAAMVVSAVFLHARYTKMHGAGVLLCVTGLALTISSDLGESNALYTVLFLQLCGNTQLHSHNPVHNMCHYSLQKLTVVVMQVQLS